MKKILFAVMILMLSLNVALAQDFGKDFTVEALTPVSSILNNPTEFKDKTVLVEGMVVDVCKKRGCWMNIAGDEPYTMLRIKVEDGVMVFPQEAKGKTAKIEGSIEVFEVTVEQLIERGKHMAEEQGIEFDPSTVKGPETIVQIRPTGVKITG